MKFRIDSFKEDMARADLVRKERKRWYARHSRAGVPFVPSEQVLLTGVRVETLYQKNVRLAREAALYDLERARERVARKVRG